MRDTLRYRLERWLRMNWDWRSIKPGWYVLTFFVLYSIVATSMLLARGRNSEQVSQPVVEAVEMARPSAAPEGLWLPIPGAQLPQNNFYLPNAARDYRRGVNQGFNFYGGDAGIPIVMGTPVIASMDGVITRVDHDYLDLSPEAWETLLQQVAVEGASEEELDQLRGRQVWLELADGWTLRYGHLARIAEGLSVGQQVYRGQVIAYAGNSGTEDAVHDRRDRGVRLHFELWTPEGHFFGQDFDSFQALRQAADRLFVGP